MRALPALRGLALDDPVRRVAVQAAFALPGLDPSLSSAQRLSDREVIDARRRRAVGSDRAALSALLRSDPADDGG